MKEHECCPICCRDASTYRPNLERGTAHACARVGTPGAAPGAVVVPWPSPVGVRPGEPLARRLLRRAGTGLRYHTAQRKREVTVHIERPDRAAPLLEGRRLERRPARLGRAGSRRGAGIGRVLGSRGIEHAPEQSVEEHGVDVAHEGEGVTFGERCGFEEARCCASPFWRFRPGRRSPVLVRHACSWLPFLVEGGTWDGLPPLLAAHGAPSIVARPRAHWSAFSQPLNWGFSWRARGHIGWASPNPSIGRSWEEAHEGIPSSTLTSNKLLPDETRPLSSEPPAVLRRWLPAWHVVSISQPV